MFVLFLIPTAEKKNGISHLPTTVILKVIMWI